MGRGLLLCFMQRFRIKSAPNALAVIVIAVWAAVILNFFRNWIAHVLSDEFKFLAAAFTGFDLHD
jgi:uncharacterized protein YacL